MIIIKFESSNLNHLLIINFKMYYGIINKIVMFPDFLYASFWGFIGTFPLVIGSILGYYFNISKKLLASFTIFSAGILSSAVCFEILFEAYSYGGLAPTVYGFLIGAFTFTIFDIIINHLNITNKKREFSSKKKNYISNHGVFFSKGILGSLRDALINVYIHKSKKEYNRYQVESLTIMTGVILDGIPEAIAIGLLVIIGGPISLALVISILIVNLFESLSGSTNMKLGGWNNKSIIFIWSFVTVLATLSATLSFIIFSNTDQYILAMALGIAAGALISLIADVMLPEAFKETHELTGLLMGLGFLTSFILSHLKFH
ncbi:hypothetical protein SDC9_08574 [bioreactor metagenome]|uniref:Zinc transporter ZupT n=2 Tax=root TaxID=1 RepID=A0A644T816_9ZZZZ